MPTNPFDDLNSLAPSQNYSEKNPFDDLFEQENKEREKKLKQILHTVSTLDPDNTGEAQKLANRLNLPPNVALNSDQTLEILKERIQAQVSTYIGQVVINDITAKLSEDKHTIMLKLDYSYAGVEDSIQTNFS